MKPTTSARPERRLYSFAEVADTLSLGRATIYDLVNRGELPVVRVGRAVRVPASALDEWVLRKTATAGDQK
jgi:putative molybdopterin biosynthesis protein